MDVDLDPPKEDVERLLADKALSPVRRLVQAAHMVSALDFAWNDELSLFPRPVA